MLFYLSTITRQTNNHAAVRSFIRRVQFCQHVLTIMFILKLTFGSLETPLIKNDENSNVYIKKYNGNIHVYQVIGAVVGLYVLQRLL